MELNFPAAIPKSKTELLRGEIALLLKNALAQLYSVSGVDIYDCTVFEERTQKYRDVLKPAISVVLTSLSGSNNNAKYQRLDVVYTVNVAYENAENNEANMLIKKLMLAVRAILHASSSKYSFASKPETVKVRNVDFWDAYTQEMLGANNAGVIILDATVVESNYYGDIIYQITGTDSGDTENRFYSKTFIEPEPEPEPEP